MDTVLSDEQLRGLRKLRALMLDYNITFGCEDPYCAAEINIGGNFFIIRDANSVTDAIHQGSLEKDW